MAKRIIDIFSRPREYARRDDIPVEEKKKLSEYFCRKGFSESTFYLRFFHKGFDQWELDGVTECKKQFLQIPAVAKSLLEYSTDVDGEDGNDRGYLYILAQSDKPGCFYDCLRKADAGLCNRFSEFMGERGMSAATVIKRFTNEHWKCWETVGIKSLLATFYSEHDKKEAEK